MASACANLLHDGDVLGLGSGSSVERFAKALGRRVAQESLKITVVPSSMQSWLLARDSMLELAKDSAHAPEKIDLVVDGADQICLSNRSMIKGGGGALLKEKINISSASHCCILGDESKYVPTLSRAVPVEIVQFAALSAAQAIKSNFPKASPILRKLDKGYPYYTESGNIILDCEFAQGISDPERIERVIKMIPGVVECGIFNCKVDKFYRAKKDGTFDSN
jgi:ribose 5-phosphate isomerase A